ncbi:MAG: NAD(P)-binding domain-containing protein [Ideonella sp.]|nr:NAD(P)-binding domain-containing protein [Ideonella sp.]
MKLLLLTVFYLAGGALIISLYLRRRARLGREAAKVKDESERTGLNEPPSLHPVVDPTLCFGSGACVRACPESALGVVNGKATLINASACIGHGACAQACPVQALSLVFGTAKRGIDIPNVTPEYETNVAGVFIAGELGGMGLIRKTAEQGRQAMGAIRRRVGKHPAPLDVVIVGAGPAGISAGLSAIHHKLRYAIVEQEDSLGGAVYHYPRHKVAMTAPVKLDVIGTMRLGTEVQKEKLLAFWNDVLAKTGLTVRFNEQFEGLEPQADSTFKVRTSKATLHARTVLLALGRRGSPRKLDVPGEDSAKVVYRLIDPEQYAGQAVLVVGGGDSALEAAIALGEQAGGSVALSYRSDAFSRVKEKNRMKLSELQRSGRIRVLLSSTVKRIDANRVLVQTADGAEELPNDKVIVCAGGVLPTPLLQSIGIRFETKRGQA